MPDPDVVIEQPPVTIDPDAAQRAGENFSEAGRKALEAAIAARDGLVPPAPTETPPAPTSTPPPKPTETKPAVGDAKKPAPALPQPTAVPRKAKEWDEAKAKVAADTAARYEAELKSLKDQLANQPRDQKVLDDLKAERDALSKQLQAVAIERHPDFQKEHAHAVTAIIETAKRVAGPQHADKIEGLLKMPATIDRDTGFATLVEALPAYKQAALGNALAEMDKIAIIKEQKVKDALANWDKLQTESRLAREQETTRERDQAMRVFNDTLAAWQDKEKGRPVLQLRDGDTDWNNKVGDAIDYAKNIVNGELDWDQMVDAALRGATHHLLLESYHGALNELEEARKEIAALKGEQPGAGGGGAPSDGGAGEGEIPAGTDYGAALAAAVRKAGVLPG